MQVNGTEFLIGCDPEVFVVDADGKPVSAHGMIPGTKDNPHAVEKGMVQVDGMALEFGIDPAATEDEFVENISTVMTQLSEMLPKGHSILIEPIVEFSKEIMEAQPEEALELGCEPDYNAYTLEENPKPNVDGLLIRSAGGHVHVGWGTGFPTFSKEHIEACAAAVAEMDYYLGVASLGWDSNEKRRLLYGKAGAFRPKPYGFEYRTLSNQWLKSEFLVRKVFKNTIKSIESVMGTSPRGNKPGKFCNGSLLITSEEIVNFGVSFLHKEVA